MDGMGQSLETRLKEEARARGFALVGIAPATEAEAGKEKVAPKEPDADNQ